MGTEMMMMMTMIGQRDARKKNEDSDVLFITMLLLDLSVAKQK